VVKRIQEVFSSTHTARHLGFRASAGRDPIRASDRLNIGKAMVHFSSQQSIITEKGSSVVFFEGFVHLARMGCYQNKTKTRALSLGRAFFVLGVGDPKMSCFIGEFGEQKL